MGAALGSGSLAMVTSVSWTSPCRQPCKSKGHEINNGPPPSPPPLSPTNSFLLMKAALKDLTLKSARNRVVNLILRIASITVVSDKIVMTMMMMMMMMMMMIMTMIMVRWRNDDDDDNDDKIMILLMLVMMVMVMCPL